MKRKSCLLWEPLGHNFTEEQKGMSLEYCGVVISEEMKCVIEKKLCKVSKGSIWLKCRFKRSEADLVETFINKTRVS